MTPHARTVTLDEFLHLDSVLLIDCEFTCWEDSLRSQWADSSRPAELIEIALVEYNVPVGEIGESFHALVRPSLNPELSAYCKGLTSISQADVDGAPCLPEVLIQINAWRSRPDRYDAPICEWDRGDLPMIAQDARRHGCATPFEGVRQISLQDLYRTVVSREAFGDGERDTIRRYYGLPRCQSRHRAFPDALDLAGFLTHLRKIAKNE